MNKLGWLLGVWGIFCAAVAGAQESGQYWIKYQTEYKLGKFSLASELENRRWFNPNEQQQIQFRLTGHYRLRSSVILSASLTYSREFDLGDRFYIPEIRPAQQLELRHGGGRWRFSHRFRLEERFIRDSAFGKLINDYDFVLRARYRSQLEYTLSGESDKKGYVGLQASTELLVRINQPKTFLGQNRSYAGLVYQLSNPLTVELGYMRIHRFRYGSRDNQTHAAVLTLQHALN